ncbi:hypothetical protein I5M32_13030 [Pedobacter sp. SD-b]|uniref:Beta-lactamase-inhibitor-like, PepSY-like n=1 Tax=Pedobacter segetis TaxID=2793069 RepID=A0ABS1BLW5_9SPHI|nr:hypothetical protein [Pedobacter segetis]MBK0383885.1 hypothetical protein [Pedobacter segetis]
MKKIILSAALLAFVGLATVQAGELKQSSAIVNTVDSTKSTPVKLEDLPAPVKATLASDAYKDWTPTEAFMVVEEGGKSYYQVNVKKEEKTGSVKINADGTPAE